MILSISIQINEKKDYLIINKRVDKNGHYIKTPIEEYQVSPLVYNQFQVGQLYDHEYKSVQSYLFLSGVSLFIIGCLYNYDKRKNI